MTGHLTEVWENTTGGIMLAEGAEREADRCRRVWVGDRLRQQGSSLESVVRGPVISGSRGEGFADGDGWPKVRWLRDKLVANGVGDPEVSTLRGKLVADGWEPEVRDGRRARRATLVTTSNTANLTVVPGTVSAAAVTTSTSLRTTSAGHGAAAARIAADIDRGAAK